MIEVKNCPVCGSPNHIPYHTAVGRPLLQAKSPVGNVPAYPVIEYVSCINCGMIWQTPRLDSKALVKFYASGFYRTIMSMTEEQMDKDEMERSLSVFNTVNQLLEHHTLLSHLDVGCSRGYLLGITKAKGLSVQGVDLNVDYREDKDIPVVAKFPDHTTKSFDLVTSIHTLEHVENPMADLRKYYELTKPGGWLVLEVPSEQSPGSPLRWAHLSYFLPHVLHNMVRAVGYKITAYILTPHQRVVAYKESK